MEITTKQQITEQVIRNLDKVEKGLKLIDTNVSALADFRLDIIALDGENRMVLICLREKPQSFKSKRGMHILKESVATWDWVVDFRDDFFDGIVHISEIVPISIPPRLFLIAPEYASNLIDLAAVDSTRIDLELFTFDPKNFDASKPVAKVSLDNRSKVNPSYLKQYNEFHNIDVRELRKKTKNTLISNNGRAYLPVTANDHIKRLDKNESTYLKLIIEELKKNDISSYSSKRNIFFVDENGENIARILFGPGKTTYLEFLTDKPITKEKLSQNSLNKVLALAK